MKRVLVLCIGNSCRSQMAEGYLKFYGAGMADYCSAGIFNNGVHPIAVQVMAEDSIDIAWHKSKTVETFRDQHFDYVISVCDNVTDQVPNYISYDYLDCLHIPDPASFVGSTEATINEFRRVRELLKMYVLKFIGKELALTTPFTAQSDAA